LACPRPRRPRQHGQCPGQSVVDLPALGRRSARRAWPAPGPAPPFRGLNLAGES